MSRKNKNSESPITLFSFQDIITSITGIMILVVLMLILHIIDSNSSSVKKDNTYTKDISSIKNTLAELRKQLDDEKDWQKMNEKVIEDALSTDIDSLPLMIKEEEKIKSKLEENIAKHKNEITEMQKKIKSLENSNTELDRKIKDGVETVSALKKQIEDTVKALKDSLEKVKKEEEEEKKKVYFSFERQEGKEPILVECSKSGLKVKIIKSNEIISFEDDSNTYVKIVNSFTGWLQKRGSTETEYLVFTVKPSASGYLQTLLNKIRDLKYQTGLEPVEENMITVF